MKKIVSKKCASKELKRRLLGPQQYGGRCEVEEMLLIILIRRCDTLLSAWNKSYWPDFR